MVTETNLKRFIDAQKLSYERALTEVKNGKKQSHWMWYIFPQIHGFGFSETSKFYAIQSIDEASEYLQHPILGNRIVEISTILLGLSSNNALQVFGSPDNMKLQSCMTLFSSVPDAKPVFKLVLQKFFNGTPDNKTLQIIKN